MDGYWWTYNSRRAFSEMFPYLTDSQVKTALEKLTDCGLIVKGDYNKANYDRTNWYAPAESAGWGGFAIGEKSPMDWSEITNGLVKNRQPIPDSKPDIKPVIDDGSSDNLFRDVDSQDKAASKKQRADEEFERFWKSYPKKDAKAAARKNFDREVRSGADVERIIEGARRYATWLASAKPGEFRPIAKFAQGWLTDQRWNDEEIWKAGSDDDPSLMRYRAIRERAEAAARK